MRPRASRVLPLSALAAGAALAHWSAAAGTPTGAGTGVIPAGGPASASSQRACDVVADQVALPATVALGGRTTITITLQADCSKVQVPAHFALVYDNSVAMGGTRMNFMKESVPAFVDAVDLSVARVGLARYHGVAEVLVPLTDDGEALAEAAFRSFRPELGSDLTMAIRAGRMLLEDGRDLAVVPNPDEVIVLLVGSANEEGPEEALAEAQAAKDAGMTIVTIAAGIEADVEMLEAMASSPSLFYSEGTSSRWPSLYQQIARDIGSVRLTGAAVSNTLPDSFDYVFGSGFPVPRIRDKELSWQFGVWPPDGLAMEYELEALTLGRHPVSRGASAELMLDRGPPIGVQFPVPDVEVVEGPSATPPPATVTAVPTATPHLRQLFLPLLTAGECLVGGPPTDLVVVVDASASMLTRLPDATVPLDHAIHAGAQLIDALAFPADRAAVVAAGAAPAVVTPLTRSRGGAISALGRSFAHVGTPGRLGRALTTAAALLDDPGAYPGPATSAASVRRAIVVLITDGDDDPAAVDRAATRLRERGRHVAVLASDAVPPRWAQGTASPGLGIRVPPEAWRTAVEPVVRSVRCGVLPRSPRTVSPADGL